MDVAKAFSEASGASAVLFDMDGTLVDTENLFGAALFNVIERHGAKIVTRHTDAWLGATEDEFYRGVCGLHGLEYTPEMEQEIRAEFALQVSKTDTLYPETKQLLGELLALREGQEFPRYGICTAAGAWKLAINLRSLGEEARLFDGQACCDDVEHSKPAPDLYLKCAERLGVDPSRCLVVEDTLTGVRGATAAGMPALAVTHTYKQEDFEALEVPPVKIVARLDAECVLQTLQSYLTER